MKREVARKMVWWLDRFTDESLNLWINEWTDGWMGDWVWMNGGGMDQQMNSIIITIKHINENPTHLWL